MKYLRSSTLVTGFLAVSINLATAAVVVVPPGGNSLDCGQPPSISPYGPTHQLPPRALWLPNDDEGIKIAIPPGQRQVHLVTGNPGIPYENLSTASIMQSHYSIAPLGITAFYLGYPTNLFTPLNQGYSVSIYGGLEKYIGYPPADPIRERIVCSYKDLDGTTKYLRFPWPVDTNRPIVMSFDVSAENATRRADTAVQFFYRDRGQQLGDYGSLLDQATDTIKRKVVRFVQQPTASGGPEIIGIQRYGDFSNGLTDVSYEIPELSGVRNIRVPYGENILRLKFTGERRLLRFEGSGMGAAAPTKLFGTNNKLKFEAYYPSNSIGVGVGWEAGGGASAFWTNGAEGSIFTGLYNRGANINDSVVVDVIVPDHLIDGPQTQAPALDVVTLGNNCFLWWCSLGDKYRLKLNFTR
jgi:hypothetical protein